MQYKQILQFIQSIIDAVQNGSLLVGREIRSLSNKVLRVQVENPQTEMEVRGKVEVDQSGTQKQLKDVSLALRELRSALKPLKEIAVTNFPKQSPFPKIPEFPKKIEISNMTKEVDMNIVVDALGKVEKAVSKMKLDPTIKVDAPVVNVPAPVVNIPAQKAPIVNVDAPDLSSITEIVDFLNELGPKKPLPVQLSDGKKFYTALQKMADIYAGSNSSSFQTADGSEGRGILNRYNELRVTVNDTWDANDVDKVTDILTYFGEETTDGAWRVRSVTKSGTITSIRHATERNNPTITSYEEAWTARASLDYGYAREL